MSEYTIFASFGIFVVWMQRHGRWSMMLQAMENKATVVGTKRASTAPIKSTGQATKHKATKSTHHTSGGGILTDIKNFFGKRLTGGLATLFKGL